MYKDGTAAMKRWRLDVAGRPAIDAPFHEGAVRYLKEIGVWTEEDQAWNEKRQARLDALVDAWDDFKSENGGMAEDAFMQAWMERRQEVISSLD
jgi:hypothetical protein